MSRKIHWIICHCSDSDVPTHDNIDTIKDWHVNQNGWSDVGYHYFLRKDGTVEIGRPEDKIGSHVKGHNSNSIGICMSGKKDFTEAQFRALEVLLIDICGRHNLEKKDILGHCDLNGNKTCPNFDLHGWLSGLNWH